MNNVFEKIIDLGVMGYGEALQKQFELHDKVVQGSVESALIFVEHPAVLTLGKSAILDHILDADDDEVEIIKTDRGGEVTAHTLGQIVVYPIVPIQRWKLSPRRYVELLEETVIRVLGKMDIPAVRDQINPGVWVKNEKICAVGIRIKNRVSMHGMALNYDCDLSIFSKIIACGVVGRGVTRIRDHLSQQVDKESVKKLWIDEFNSIFS